MPEPQLDIDDLQNKSFEQLYTTLDGWGACKGLYAGVPRLAHHTPLNISTRLPELAFMHGMSEEKLAEEEQTEQAMVELTEKFAQGSKDQGWEQVSGSPRAVVEMLAKMTMEAAQKKQPRIVNEWWCERLQTQIYLKEDPVTRRRWAVKSREDGPGMRLTLRLKAVACATVLSAEAEQKAQQTLRSHLTLRQWHAYQLTGMFAEHSPRSKVVYLFRKVAPTVAMVADGLTKMRMLSVLCLHPIGHYDGSPLGVMAPSDDVLAHLLLMRADEHLFWRKANHHHAWEAESLI